MFTTRQSHFQRNEGAGGEDGAPFPFAQTASVLCCRLRAPLTHEGLLSPSFRLYPSGLQSSKHDTGPEEPHLFCPHSAHRYCPSPWGLQRTCVAFICPESPFLKLYLKFPGEPASVSHNESMWFCRGRAHSLAPGTATGLKSSLRPQLE